jgi:hypothetical protein
MLRLCSLLGLLSGHQARVDRDHLAGDGRDPSDLRPSIATFPWRLEVCVS